MYAYNLRQFKKKNAVNISPADYIIKNTMTDNGTEYIFPSPFLPSTAMGDDQQFSAPVHHPNSLATDTLGFSQPIQNQQPTQYNVFEYSFSCPPELCPLRDASELILSSSIGLLIFTCFICMYLISVMCYSTVRIAYLGPKNQNVESDFLL